MPYLLTLTGKIMIENNIGKEKKVIFSALKPTGDLTIGNYIGALKTW